MKKRYDDANNKIYYTGNNGYTGVGDLDERGNEIHYKDNYGYESWTEYDQNNNRIKFKDNYGFGYVSEFYENNKLKRTTHYNGIICSFDHNGNITIDMPNMK